ALRESPGEDRYIVTVASKGYRFAAPVKAGTKVVASTAADVSLQTQKSKRNLAAQVAMPEEWRQIPAQVPATSEPPAAALRLFHRPRILLAVVVSVAIALVALGYLIRQRQSVGSRFTRSPRSLAILPFHNLKQDPSSDFLGFSLP